MERGVYGIGGFLQVSGELQVLWSGAYLPVAQEGFWFPASKHNFEVDPRPLISEIQGFRV